MIFFLLAAVILYVVVPAGLVVGVVVAVPVGALAAVTSIVAGGPGVSAAARLTGSPRPRSRAAGWGLLAVCSLGATGAAAVALVVLLLVGGATSALPTFLPFVG